MFKIGDFSKITQVSIRMLRYYDEIDLFKPAKIDDFTSYRYYSATQIPELNLIITLRDFGFGLGEIQTYLKETDKVKQRELLEKKQREIKETISSSKNRLSKLKDYILNYDKESVLVKGNVEIKRIPSIKVCALRKIIPRYDSEGELWQEYMQKSGPLGLQWGRNCYAEFYEEGYKENAVDIEIIMEVKELQEDVNGLVFKETEPIEQAATLLVKGAYYPNIKNGFNFIGTWIEENNYKICGPSRTYYIVGPDGTNTPDDYVTEIVIPVTK